MQTIFVKHLESAGWPPAGRLANADAYDRFVGEHLKERGHKVAYLMVDALRYELGVALEKLVSEDGLVALHTAYAQLPTITPVGMASLLPGAKADLALEYVNDSLVPTVIVWWWPQRSSACAALSGSAPCLGAWRHTARVISIFMAERHWRKRSPR